MIYPVPNGVLYELLLEMLRTLSDRLTVVGSSLLEFVPGPSPRVDRLRDLAGVLAL